MLRTFALLGAMAISGCTTPPPADPRPPVIGWVAPYAMDASMQALDATPPAANGVTRIGLQFWNPGADGTSVVYAPVDTTGKLVTDADVQRFRDWARPHGTAVLLTVYNNSAVTNRWDWPLARKAFVNHRSEF